MDNPLFCKNRRGAVLVIVLAVMLVLGLLGGSFYGMVASERQEVARRHAKSQAELGPELVKAYNIQTLTSCSTCHR